MLPIKSAALTLFHDYLNLKSSEVISFIADDKHKSLASALYEYARDTSAATGLVIVSKIPRRKDDLLKFLNPFLSRCHVILLLTEDSLSHTPSRRRLCRSGARIASMPNITEECFIRAMKTDLSKQVALSNKLADILTIAHNVSIESSSGTNLTLSLKGRRGYKDTGLIHEAGNFANIPAGEASAAPLPRSANGVLVVDGSFARIGILKKPVKMFVRDGRVIRITGCEEARQISRLLSRNGKESRVIGEVSIGTNPGAKFTGITLEDEKVMGTMHIGLGNNISFGGNNSVECHFDGILLDPSLKIDGKDILKHGIFYV